jgi:hypothetical protein
MPRLQPQIHKPSNGLKRPTSLWGCGIPAATYEPHPLNSVAAHATILDYIVAPGIGTAFLNPHRLFANDAAQKINQRAFVVVQWTLSSPRPTHFPFAFSAISTSRRMASGRPGRSSWRRRQSSISETESVEIRTLTAMVSTGGLPRFGFLALSIVDFMVL